MIKKYTALFLVLLVAAGEANTINLVKTWQTINLLKNGHNWEEGLTANLNDYIDETISTIVPFIEENGLDPMQLPDIQEEFKVKPLWVTYSAGLTLTKGSMTGLVHIARSGDQEVFYTPKVLRTRLQLQFNDLNIIYNYVVKVMNIGPSGGISATLNRFDVVFDVVLDFNNDEIQLQDFKLTNVGNLKIRLTGNWLTDWLINPLANAFLRIFNSTIMRAVESNVKGALQKGIGGLNQNLKDIINRLESYN